MGNDEESVHDHAAEQVRINETMARSMAKLVSHNDLTGFLNTMLLEAIASAGAVSGVVLLHDPANDTLVQTAHVLRGRVIDVAHDPDAAAFRQPIPASRESGWDLFSEGRPILWADYASHQPTILAETAVWHHAMGHRFASGVPMKQDGRPIGLIGLAWDRSVETRPEEARLRVCQALAQHATLAVRLTRLAEDARTAAVAHEREQAERERAAELAKANVALRRSLAALASAPQTHQFFEHLLQGIAEQFNPIMCNVWTVREDGLVELAAMLVEDQTLGRAQVVARFPDFPTPRPFHVPPELIGGVPAAAHRRHYHLPDIREAPLLHHVIGQTGIDWYTRRGVRQELNIPLHVGEKGLGALSMYFGPEHVVTPGQIELGYALAQQAALALELTRLADAEKAAAIAREREQAAQDRAAEQARINDAFSRSIAKLVSHNDLAGFLNAVLLEAIAHSGAVSGAVLLHDRARGAFVQTAHVLRGRVVDVASDPAVAIFRERIPTEGDGTGTMLSGSQEFFWTDYAEPQPSIWPEVAAWHHEMGHRFAVGVPMMYGAEPVGLLGLAWDRSVETRPDDACLKICVALTQQATTAVRLTRLTEAVRAGATREERTRIARDLHDSLAQGFTGIIVQLEAVESALASEDIVKARARVASAGELARDSLQQARRAVHALRPSILEGKDLTTALKGLIEATFTGSSVEVETCLTGVSRPLPSDVEEHLLRIAQEALTNVFKHARARHVGVCVTYEPDEVCLKIHDDGRGFGPSHHRPDAHGGLGLVGIRERADRLGAALVIENQPGGGACVRVTLPTPGRV